MGKLLNRWSFLAVVLLAWATIAGFVPGRAQQAFALFTDLLAKVIPALGFVFVLLFIANFFASGTWAKHQLGRVSGLRGWLVALFGGLVATGPIYVWYALMGEVKREGLSSGLIATFLYALGVKLPLIPLLVHYFGLTYTLVLIFWMLVFALIGGWVVDLLERRRDG